jgi:hypothetical protein
MPAELMPARAAPAALPATQPSNTGSLMALIDRAISDPAFDPAKLMQLLEVRDRWEATEARKAFNAAFAAFKASAVQIVKNRVVKAGPLTGSRYAELFSVVNAVTPALSANGLSASWKLTRDEKDWIEVTCTVKHAAGHSESVSMGGPPDAGGAKSAIQARASTVTYLERYTLKAITGLSEQGDDDDGRAPTQQAPRERPEIPHDVRVALQDAAKRGTDELKSIWSGISQPTRDIVTGHHSAWWNEQKAVAQQVQA